MTLSGTNSYVIDCGRNQALVIDPGPPIAAHVEAIEAGVRARRLTVAAIAVTHGHPDHAPAAALLAARCGAPVYAHPSGTVARDHDLVLNAPLRVGNVEFYTIDAPGHTFDHAVFYLPSQQALFTGDVVLGEGTSVIAPPHGAMRPYLQTLERLATEFAQARTIYGGHGERVDNAQAKIAEYLEHRRMREREILAALTYAELTIPQLVLHVYGTARPELRPAMARQMLAHLIAFEDDGRVAARRLERPMTAQESWMLNPQLESLVGAEQAAVIAAELGSSLHLDDLYAYRALAP